MPSSQQQQLPVVASHETLHVSEASPSRRDSVVSQYLNFGHTELPTTTTTAMADSSDSTKTPSKVVTFVKTLPDGNTVKLDECNIELKQLANTGSSNNLNSSKPTSSEPVKVDVASKRRWIPFFSLFRYATLCDRLFLLLGFFFSFLSTWPGPALNLIYGEFVNKFVHYEAVYFKNGTDAMYTETDDPGAQSRMPLLSSLCDGRINRSSYDKDFPIDYEHDYLLCEVFLLSGGLFLMTLWYAVGIFSAVLCYERATYNQVLTIKKLLFGAVIRQDIEWFDEQSTFSSLGDEEAKETKKSKVKGSQFTSRVASHLKYIEAALNDNTFTLLLFFISWSIWSAAFAFYFSWKLTLIIFSTSGLVLGGTSAFLTRLKKTVSAKAEKGYAAAGTVASEMLTAIRTVFAFGGEAKAQAKYEAQLLPAAKSASKLSLLTSIGNAVLWSGFYFGFAVGLWFGVRMITDHSSGISLGTIIAVFWCAGAVGLNMGYAGPFLETMHKACSSAQTIFDMIEKEPKIHKRDSNAGARLPSNYRPCIEFRGVHFAYPSRPRVPILRGIDLHINPGEVVALVGPSGVGKSTVIQLLQRFYDPLGGAVLLDGVNISELNLGWLREQFGVVGQEPVLFDCSIGDNIRLGATSEQMAGLTEEELERAAKAANAHEFIARLPEGYKTKVGERGAKLSGGQKQRIAIARALVKNPPILLLDEATSALDLKSEAIVQAALDRASRGRTTIIVAHRLSTIANADRIVCMTRNGTIAEVGTYSQLMEAKGVFCELVMRQAIGLDEKEMPSEEEDMAEEPEPASAQLPDELPKEEAPTTPKSSSPKQGFGNIIRNVSFSFAKSSELSDAETQARAQYTTWFVVKRTLRLLFESPICASIGVVSSALFGLCIPLYAFIFGNFLAVFTKPSKNESLLNDPNTTYGLKNEYLYEQSTLYAGLFLGLAGLAFVTSFLQLTFFGLASQRLVRRVRQLSFRAIVVKPIWWHERPEHSSGVLCAQLATGPIDIEGSTGPRVAVLCQATTSMVVAAAFGLYTCWHLSLVGLFFVPLIAYSTGLRVKKLDAGREVGPTNSNAIAVKMAQEVLLNVRTIASLHKEAFFERYYGDLLERSGRVHRRTRWCSSILLAVSAACPAVAYAATFLYGGYLIAEHKLTTAQFFRVIEAMIFGAIVFGQACFYSSDFAKAKQAAINFFRLLSSTPTSPPNPFTGEAARVPSLRLSLPPRRQSLGAIEFRGVFFSYPSRPTVQVLNGVSFKVEPGQKIALVGQSGCGKTTLFQLLERFYEPTNGRILLDNINLASQDPHWVRSQMALVSQEPALFSGTIAENIAFGDNSRELIPLHEIINAAKKAALHDFVESLPEKYKTKVGQGGCQLSGGQKQRLAIARALLRNAPILLLDEATSALDANSEKQIQTILEVASSGRTSLTIAHRLSTIVNADLIFYLDRGTIVEAGTHEQLLGRRGQYWSLYNQQTRKLGSKQSSRNNIHEAANMEPLPGPSGLCHG